MGYSKIIKGPFGLAALASLFALALVGCGKHADELAVVNGQPISQQDFHDYLERKQTVYAETSSGPQEVRVAGNLGLQALRDLVDRKLVLQLAQQQGAVPTDAEIMKELDFRTKQRSDYVNYLTGQGMTLQMIKDDLRYDLAREHLLTAGIKISNQDVDDYVRANPSKFVEPAQAQLMYIVVSNASKKADVDRELESGQSFQVVATRFSEAPQARENGGLYPVTDISKMPKRLQLIVGKTGESQTSPWELDGKNWFRFYIERKVPAKKIPMDGLRREIVRRQLALQQGAIKNDLGKRLAESLRTAKIDVHPDYLRGPWQKAIDKLDTKVASK